MAPSKLNTKLEAKALNISTLRNLHKNLNKSLYLDFNMTFIQKQANFSFQKNKKKQSKNKHIIKNLRI